MKGKEMKNLFFALAIAVFGSTVIAGEGPAKEQAAKPAPVKAEKTVLVPKTVYKKETVLVPKTVVKKETVMVPCKVVESDCCELSCNVRGRLRDRVGRLGTRVRGVAACDCCD
jgi:hypothetical protein